MSVAEELLITKDVPFTIVPTERMPGVPPTTAFVKNIKLDEVTAVVEMVIVPAVIAADFPAEAFVPVVILSLLPAVFSVKFPVTDTAPGVVIGAARAKTTSPVEGVAVIWLVVPETDVTAPVPWPSSVQVAPDEGDTLVKVYVRLEALLTHFCPIM